MSGLVLKDKKPRKISDVSMDQIHKLVSEKVLKVPVVNSDGELEQADVFIKKMTEMRKSLTTSSKARAMVSDLEKQIRANDGTFSQTQVHDRRSTLSELL